MTNREILEEKKTITTITKQRPLTFHYFFKMDQFVKGLKKSSYHPFVRLSISVLTAEVVLSEVSHSLPVKQPKNTHRAQS